MSKEFRQREIEFRASALVMLAELGRSIGKFVVPMPDFLANNSGDFAAGYLGNWFLNYTLESVSRFRSISENKRLLISAGVTFGAIAAVETVPIFGTPQLKDIPAGVAGILASYGVRKLAQRWVGIKT